MRQRYDTNRLRFKTTAFALVAALSFASIGCGSVGSQASNSTSGATLPPIDDTRNGTMPATTRSNVTQPNQGGPSTKNKIVMLAGAAALYYLYRKHQQKNQAQASGTMEGQPVYYLSKNGRVYYRDASGQAHWVTPPRKGIPVQYEEAQRFRDLQGYDGSSTGATDLTQFDRQFAGSGRY